MLDWAGSARRATFDMPSGDWNFGFLERAEKLDSAFQKSLPLSPPAAAKGGKSRGNRSGGATKTSEFTTSLLVPKTTLSGCGMLDWRLGKSPWFSRTRQVFSGDVCGGERSKLPRPARTSSAVGRDSRGGAPRPLAERTNSRRSDEFRDAKQRSAGRRRRKTPQRGLRTCRFVQALLYPNCGRDSTIILGQAR